MFVESMIGRGGAKMTGEVFIAHVHVEVLRVVEISRAKAAELVRERETYTDADAGGLE